MSMCHGKKSRLKRIEEDQVTLKIPYLVLYVKRCFGGVSLPTKGVTHKEFFGNPFCRLMQCNNPSCKGYDISIYISMKIF